MFDYPMLMFELMLKGQVQGIFFWVVFYTTVACIVSFVIQIKIMRWPSVIGTLIKLEIGGSGSEQAVQQRDNFLEAEYRYDIAEESYTGKRVSPTVIWTLGGLKCLLKRQIDAVEKLPDGKVRLFYNPKAPQKSYLIRPSKIALGMTLLPSIFFLYLYVSSYF